VKKPTPFGKYYLLERINVGGMAEVFRAKAFGVEGFERLVAVKRILPNIAEDKEFIRMFIEEAKLSVQLNHANIAQIFDLGVVDGAYYIASLDGVIRSMDGVAWTRAWGQKDSKTALVQATTFTETTIFGSDSTNFYSAPLKDFTNWAPLKGPAGNTDSATYLAYDPSHHLLYASCWGGGVFRYTPPN